jgi:hypothetical protein
MAEFISNPATSKLSNITQNRTDASRLAGWKTLLGELINYGARLRFFPHRIVMFLSLAELTQDRNERARLIASAEETFSSWTAIVQGLTHTQAKFGISPELSPWVDELMALDRASFDQVTSHFALGAASVIKNMKGGRPQTAELLAIAHFVAENLLARMNKLVDDFAAELANVAVREREHSERATQERAAARSSSTSVIRLTEELNRVNSTVHMISLNALIQAARSGDSGKAFGIIAIEIQKLSGEIKALTKDIRNALEGAE